MNDRGNMQYDNIASVIFAASSVACHRGRSLAHDLAASCSRLFVRGRALAGVSKK